MSSPLCPAPPTDDATAADSGALERMARVLESSDAYQVLRRFEPRGRYRPSTGRRTRTALFVDVETTGLDAQTDAVIEFAALPFVYGVADGLVYESGAPLSYLEEPTRPIPAEITRLTGLTAEDVRGRRIDDAAVAALAASASLVIAHNAAFDRPFVARRLPALAALPWACSMTEVPWAAYGCRGTRLEYLLLQRCGEFFDGHRAAADCQAGVHVLATPLPDGTPPLGLLLAAARAPTVRVWAPDAPYSASRTLRARGYRWHAGDAVRAKAWYRDVAPAAADAEDTWLATAVYGGRRARGVREIRTALTRYLDGRR